MTQGRTQGEGGCQAAAPPPPNPKIKNTDFVGIMISKVVCDLKQSAHNNRQFQTALSTFLHSKSFYTVEEYFNCE
jgi:hypothetical protein